MLTSDPAGGQRDVVFATDEHVSVLLDLETF